MTETIGERLADAKTGPAIVHLNVLKPTKLLEMNSDEPKINGWWLGTYPDPWSLVPADTPQLPSNSLDLQTMPIQRSCLGLQFHFLSVDFNYTGLYLNWLWVFYHVFTHEIHQNHQPYPTKIHQNSPQNTATPIWSPRSPSPTEPHRRSSASSPLWGGWSLPPAIAGIPAVCPGLDGQVMAFRREETPSFLPKAYHKNGHKKRLAVIVRADLPKDCWYGF